MSDSEDDHSSTSGSEGLESESGSESDEHELGAEESKREEEQDAAAQMKRPGQRQIKRQLEAYNILPTWGTESAEEYNLSPQQLLDLVFDIENKVALYRLSTVLADPEIASCFISMEGLPALMHCLTALSGNSLAYAVNALLSFARHDFAIDEIASEVRHLVDEGTQPRVHRHPMSKQPVYCREQLFQVIATTQEGSEESSGERRADNVRALHLALEVMTHICSRAMNAFTFVHCSPAGATKSSQIKAFYKSITAPLDHRGLDVQLACLRLVNSLVSCARDPDEYDTIVRHLGEMPEFMEQISTLKDESSNVALLREISRFETLTTEGFGHKSVLLMMKTDILQLQKQLQDVSAVATEYMSSNKKLQAELSAFRRREPMVQLLWKEIMHCRKALAQAIQAGFSFDLGAPNRRWAPPAGMADIGQLWVLDRQFGGGLVKSSSSLHDLDSDDSGDEASDQGHQQFMRLGDAPTTAEILEREIVRSTSTDEVDVLLKEEALAVASGGLLLPPPSGPAGAILAPPSLGPGGMLPPPPSSGAVLGAGGMLSAPPSLMRAPQPTKPVVKPPAKMKPLHWRRIIIEDKTADSIWNQIGDNFNEKHLKLDTQATVLYFEDKKRKKRPEVEGGEDDKGRGGRGGGGSGKGASRIVDDKTFQTLSILLRSLPPLSETVRAIRELDSTMLSGGQVSRIQKSLPDQDMMQKVLISPEMDSELSLPDLYVRELARIPQISARLDCWCFALNFEEKLADIRNPVELLRSAIEASRSSEALRKALGAVLTVGNYLNGNTTRGQADGFQLETLGRLKGVKDSETGNLTLLQFIVDCSVERFGEEFSNRLWTELQPCVHAREHSVEQITGDVSSFTQAVNTKQKLGSLVTSASSSEDRFASVMRRFNGKAEKAVETLRQDALAVKRGFDALKVWMDPFGKESDLKQVKSTDFFGALVELAESFKACHQRRVREKEEAEERRRMLERQEQARKEREQRLADQGEAGERKGLKLSRNVQSQQTGITVADFRGQLKRRGGKFTKTQSDVDDNEWEDGKQEKASAAAAAATATADTATAASADEAPAADANKTSRQKSKPRATESKRSHGSESGSDSDANLEPEAAPAEGPHIAGKAEAKKTKKPKRDKDTSDKKGKKDKDKKDKDKDKKKKDKADKDKKEKKEKKEKKKEKAKE